MELIIREMQVKTTMKYHAELLEWLQQTSQAICWLRFGETGALIHCWWDHKMAQSLWKAH